MSEKQIEVWIKGKFVTVVPAENEQNVREDLETRYSGDYLIKPHLSAEQRKELAAPIFKKIDLLSIQKEAKEGAQKEIEELKAKKDLTNTNPKKKKNETV